MRRLGTVAALALAVCASACGGAHAPRPPHPADGAPGTGATVARDGRAPAGGSPTSSGRAGSRAFATGGVTVAVPSGWHATARPLTAVGSPIQRLAVASFPLDGAPPARGCSPAATVARMPAGGALIAVLEYEGTAGAGFPARRVPVALGPPRRYECFGRSTMVRFRVAGRAFQAHIWFGARASAATRRAAAAVLDGLRAAPRSARAAARWVPPSRVLARAPYLGVACRRANRFACDRVGLAVWLRRAPASPVAATIDGRALTLTDPGWSSQTGRMAIGYLHPAGMVDGPLHVVADDGPGRYVGRRPVHAGIGLWIEDRPGHVVRTSTVVVLSAGWG